MLFPRLPAGAAPGFVRRLGQEMEFELSDRPRRASDRPGLEVTGVWEAPSLENAYQLA